MLRSLPGSVVALILACCTTVEPRRDVLTIRWQRLVDDSGETCDRCGTTEEAVHEAHERLRESLARRDIEVRLVTSAINEAEFRETPEESNRIWIDEEPLEALLGAEAGRSVCGDACGDCDCRTLVLDGTAYEAVPADLIVQAGLIAAGRRDADRRAEVDIVYCLE